MIITRWISPFGIMVNCLSLLLPLGNLVGVESEFNITSLNMYETSTNRNFRILLHGEPVFLRIGRDNPDQVGIDRSTEIEHYKLAEGLGLAPKLLAYQLDNGILVTEFVEGSPPSEARIHEPEVLEKITHNLRLLHDCQPSSHGRLEKNVFLKNDRLLAELAILDGNVAESEKFERWLDVRCTFESGYYNGIADGVCHGDLFRGNLLEASDGTLFLVDWEYSYFGPVIDDLGKLCSANWLTDEEISFVAELYWGTTNANRVIKIKQNIYMQQMNLYLWCKIQASHEPRTSLQYLALAARAEEHLNQLGPQLLEAATCLNCREG